MKELHAKERLLQSEMSEAHIPSRGVRRYQTWRMCTFSGITHLMLGKYAPLPLQS